MKSPQKTIPRPDGARPFGQLLLFAATVFLGAFLLFLVQPLIGKYILPRFGSSPAVWTTCLLFFQIALLAGYAYAHLLASQLSPRTQAITHALLLAAAVVLLPITPAEAESAGDAGDPTLRILLLLASSVGVPFLLLAATAPLLQSWFARTFPGRSPYRLYALSNLGSVLALMSYPTLVEPFVGLDRQTVLWSIVFAVFAVCGVLCARRSARAGEPGDGSAQEAEPTARPPAGAIAVWLALSACGAGLLMATTNHLCTDIAVVPFLWVLPLGLYLLTFIICFDSDRWYSRPFFFLLLPPALAAVCVSLHSGIHEGTIRQVAVGAGSLFICLMCCHGELARARPPIRHLTHFYLAIALGGALGGLFVAVVAPVVFDGIWEYHLLLFATWALVLLTGFRGPGRQGTGSLVLWLAFVGVTVVLTILYFDPDLWLSPDAEVEKGEGPGNLIGISLALVLLILLGCGIRALVVGRGERSGFSKRWLPHLKVAAGLVGAVPLAGALGAHAFATTPKLVLRDRNFYGSMLIESVDDAKSVLLLKHGRTLHGLQNKNPFVRSWPSSYYGPLSGVGLAVRKHPRRARAGRPFRIGVVGLGVGTMAAYANAVVLPDRYSPDRPDVPYTRPDVRKPGDRVVFYEINPMMVDWSRRHFTFLADAEERGATVEVHLGDARLVLERQLDHGEEQAFDVLVVDAFNSDAIPIHLLTSECFEIYTRHLAPDGILAFHISNRHMNLAPVVHRLARHHRWTSILIGDPGDGDFGVEPNDWVLVTRNRRFLALPFIARLLGQPRDPGPLWTDDFSSVFPLLGRSR